MNCDEYEEWLVDNDPDDPTVQVLQLIKDTGFACPNENCSAIYDL